MRLMKKINELRGKSIDESAIDEAGPKKPKSVGGTKSKDLIIPIPKGHTYEEIIKCLNLGMETENESDYVIKGKKGFIIAKESYVIAAYRTCGAFDYDKKSDTWSVDSYLFDIVDESGAKKPKGKGLTGYPDWDNSLLKALKRVDKNITIDDIKSPEMLEVLEEMDYLVNNKFTDDFAELVNSNKQNVLMPIALNYSRKID